MKDVAFQFGKVIATNWIIEYVSKDGKHSQSIIDNVYSCQNFTIIILYIIILNCNCSLKSI
jgi:hypothetical protein